MTRWKTHETETDKVNHILLPIKIHRGRDTHTYDIYTQTQLGWFTYILTSLFKFSWSPNLHGLGVLWILKYFYFVLVYFKELKFTTHILFNFNLRNNIHWRSKQWLNITQSLHVMETNNYSFSYYIICIIVHPQPLYEADIIHFTFTGEVTYL